MVGKHIRSVFEKNGRIHELDEINKKCNKNYKNLGISQILGESKERIK